MVVSSQDVAQRAGVSRGAVSQILNGRGQRFAATTVERVKDAAADLGYEPSAAGRALARGSSDFVIALVPNTTFGRNLQDIFESATSLLAEHGLTLVLRLAATSPASLSRLVTGMRPAAVLSMTSLREEDRQVLLAHGVRLFDPSTSSPSALDDAVGALQAQVLIDAGYHRLAYAHLRDTRQDVYGGGREAGLRRHAETLGLPAPLSIALDVRLPDALTALASLGTDPVGIACYNDDVATALLTAAQVHGRSVPGDVALVGMDHTQLSQLTMPPLTTIGIDYAVVARRLAQSVAQGLGRSSGSTDKDGLRLSVVPGGTT